MPTPSPAASFSFPCRRCGATPLLRYPDGLCATHTDAPGHGVAWGVAAMYASVLYPGQRPVTSATAPGFTQVPHVREILEDYELPAQGGGRVPFNGVTGPVAHQLLDALPDAQADNRVCGSPTFGQFADFADTHPDVRLYGFRVEPGRADEGVAVEGFYAQVCGPVEQLAFVSAVADFVREHALAPASRYEISELGIDIWWSGEDAAS